MTDSVFSEKLQILRFRISTAVNMWKNAFFDHPLDSEGWRWLKLALKLVFITMKWLLTCFECICSFLLSVCTYKRLYGLYIGMGMARHAQARKNWRKNFSSSTQNGPIRKVNMFKSPNSNILKILPSTGCLQPRLGHFFTQKKIENRKFYFIDSKWSNSQSYHV